MQHRHESKSNVKVMHLSFTLMRVDRVDRDGGKLRLCASSQMMSSGPFFPNLRECRHQMSHTEEHADQLKGPMSKADVLLERSGYIGTFCDECETSRMR